MAATTHSYWLQWQVFVCALIVVSPAIAAIVVLLRHKPQQALRSSNLWAPCWAAMHPSWLLAFRAAVFICMSGLLCQTVVQHGPRLFYFYTQWTFTLVIVYFAIATVISAHGCWSYSKQNVEKKEVGNGFLVRTNEEKGSDHVQEAEEDAAGLWGYAMQVIYQTCAGAVVLTDIVFWFVLVPFLSAKNAKVDMITGCMHSLNAVFLVVDSALNSLPFPWFRIAYFVLWSSSYVTFQWILHACGFSWWPYPFLELGTPWAVLWYLGMALVHIPCYFAYYLIVKAKESFFQKLFPNSYLKSC